jgi:asparagine synthase (glutamine-hydrolysing)
MCGIAGLWDPEVSRSEGETARLIAGLTEPLAHRGPDSAGHWFDHPAGLAFGHRRLSIVDLSAEGDQPMISASGRHVIITNGEIYNHHDLRRELEGSGVRFRGHSDTEVMLETIDRLGPLEATRRMAGMFAFALWDRKERRLTLGRDRLGKKPLYVGFAGRSLVFASELKSVVAHPDFERRVDRRALQDVLKRQAVRAPWTIWQGVMKLPAGHLLSLSHSDLDRTAGEQGLLAHAEPYWELGEIAKAHVATRLAPPFGEGEALDRLDAILGVAIQERMIADVPVGAFLSGGIDSSLVVAMMQQRSKDPVKTFTASFGEAEFDEAAYAREIAERLGTDHHEVEITPEIALSVIPRLHDIYDEPFADPSGIPFFHIAKFARERVTVCLSGDGGDESFAGYGRYFMTEKIARQVARMPGPMRRTLARLMTAVPPARLDSVLGLLPMPESFGLRGKVTGDRLQKMAALLIPDDPSQLYWQMTTLNALPNDVVLGGDPDADIALHPLEQDGLEDLMHRMMLRDTLVYLPDDVLVKVDRASMAVSLEARSPLLDHRVVEFAWQLPRSYLVHDDQGKWPLRQLLERYLPNSLSNRSKRGFGVPIAAWLREPLRDWGEDLLSETRLKREGFLDPAPIRKLWQEHLSGGRDWSATLWAVLMVQAWQERWCAGASSLESAGLDAAGDAVIEPGFKEAS